MNRRGSVSLVITIVLLGLLIVGGTWYYFQHPKSSKVPEIISSNQTSTSTIVSASDPLSAVLPLATAGWKTYHNSSYGFSLRYPNDWADSSSTMAKLNLSQGLDDAYVGSDRFSVVYEPEKARCGHGVGCFYPASFFIKDIDKAQLLNERLYPSVSFEQYAENFVKYLGPEDQKNTVVLHHLMIQNHDAFEIVAPKPLAGPDSATVPRITLLIDYMPDTVLWAEMNYFAEDESYALSAYKTIRSSLIFN